VARASHTAAGRGLVARLAQLRVPLGFAGAAIVLVLAQPNRTTLIVGSSIACVGEVIRIWAAGHLRKSREVTSSGPYRWTAHPLYAGSSVMGIGLAVASRSMIVAAVIAAYLLTTLTAAITREEASLRRAFGEEYDRYRRTGEVDAVRRFSWSRAIANREHRAVAGLALAILLLCLKAAYNGVFGG
jgi:protein-S-isoprenylcysteine O-methyltransferase Ste14